MENVIASEFSKVIVLIGIHTSNQPAIAIIHGATQQYTALLLPKEVYHCCLDSHAFDLTHGDIIDIHMCTDLLVAGKAKEISK